MNLDWKNTEPPKDRSIMVWGIPEPHPSLEVYYLRPTAFVAHWEELDDRFCLNGGDWAGPFISPMYWADFNRPDVS